MASFDFIVIGAGIAGASAAWALQPHGRTLLLEREPLPGHHTTGRSAAFLVESYGSPVVGRLTRAGRNFFEKPPEGLTETPLVKPVPVIWIGREDQLESLERARVEGCEAGAQLENIEVAEALAMCPVLRADYVAGAVVERNAMHIDVAAVLEAYLRGFRAGGGMLETHASVLEIERGNGGWRVRTERGAFEAGVIVNAAGAWCDEVAVLAGVRPIGLRPLRRTAITFDPPAEHDVSHWPCVIDADEDFYFKPEGRGQILASPCDETPSEPCDAHPDDEDIARAAAAVERSTSIEIEHLRGRWAGLRSFAPDRQPVIGMDPECPGFFWLAGQGGFGIMTSPAAALATAGLATGGGLPDDLRAIGLDEATLSPQRLRGSSAAETTAGIEG
ncbi:MAG: FAD-binding oxidoreductase [Myxococcota bacterium]|jgi:D-arginine dehydrogenase|nr:FAD-binding oxidoreductase [Myxococcota bacterium]